MSDSYKKMKLRLLNCAGLGLEQGESLLKITTDSFETRFEANVAYLLDEKGKIKCTLISSKSEYESDANVDRRHTNLSNGFEIYWDGDLCTVFNKAKRKEKKSIIPKINLPAINLPENLRNKRLWIGSGVAVAVIALIIIFICIPSGNKQNPPFGSPVEPIDDSMPTPMSEKREIPRDTELFDASAESAIAEAEQKQAEEQTPKELENKVKGITDRWIAQLHNDNVSVATLNKIQDELNNMQGKEKELAQGIIAGYLKEYTFLFNNVKSIADTKNLHQRYYSREQWKILREVYGKGTKEFNTAYKNYGINFVKTKNLLP